jgi:hypothetical protein
METLVFITSIIKPPNTPLSYGTRSVYTSQERFEQTKITIQSVKEKIPNSKIFLIECSDLNEQETNYFLQNTTYFLNLYNNANLRNNMHSPSKSLCEGTMTVCGLQFLIQNNIAYDNLIKISGRYYLSERFDFCNFMNDDIVIKYINGDVNNVFTGLYKIPRSCTNTLFVFLQNSFKRMIACVGYEVLFADFIKTQLVPKKIVNPIGLMGYVSVSKNEMYDG